MVWLNLRSRGRTSSQLTGSEHKIIKELRRVRGSQKGGQRDPQGVEGRTFSLKKGFCMSRDYLGCQLKRKVCWVLSLPLRAVMLSPQHLAPKSSLVKLNA